PGPGYWRRSDLTAERFVPDSLVGYPGARLYKSGDLARMRHDGAIEFLGRIDRQVKLRGFRIELAEIESALCAYPGVTAAVVILHTFTPSDIRLLAYVCSPEPGCATADELRSLLKKRLPEDMVPAGFAVLQSMPLLSNGKLDRARLPLIAEAHGNEKTDYIPPSSDLERKLSQLWHEMLKVDRVGLNDDFFELGGHSLLAMQVNARLRGWFKVDLPLRELFEFPRLKELVARVEQRMRDTIELQFPAIAPVAGDQRAPLSFAQHRLWFIDQMEPGGSVYNIPIALRLEGALRFEAL